MSAQSGTQVDRSMIENYLTTCIEKLKSDATREMLKDTSSGRPGVAVVNEVTESVWDELGIPMQEGRRHVEMLEQYFPDDSSLVSLRTEFAQASDAAYWQCLEDRRPNALEKEAKMPRVVLMDFFTAGFFKMSTPEVKHRLRNSIEETGNFPEAVVHDVFGDILELLGFEREHGQACCRSAFESDEYANDRELIMAHVRWEQKVDNDCLTLLNEYRKGGGVLKVNDVVKAKLTEFQAKDELDTMSPEERGKLLEKNARKVDVFRNLPADGRQRYLDKLNEEERLELTKSEILMVTIAQMQQQRRAAENQIRQTQNVD